MERHRECSGVVPAHVERPGVGLDLNIDAPPARVRESGPSRASGHSHRAGQSRREGLWVRYDGEPRATHRREWADRCGALECPVADQLGVQAAVSRVVDILKSPVNNKKVSIDIRSVGWFSKRD